MEAANFALTIILVFLGIVSIALQALALKLPTPASEQKVLPRVIGFRKGKQR